MGTSYDREPIALLDNCYMEIHTDYVLKVPLSDVTTKEKVQLPQSFPD